MDDGLKMISPLSMRRSCIICWQRAMTLAEVAERLAASRAPSYATSETDCLKKIRSQISIAPNITMRSNGSEIANSMVAPPLRWDLRDGEFFMPVISMGQDHVFEVIAVVDYEYGIFVV